MRTGGPDIFCVNARVSPELVRTKSTALVVVVNIQFAILCETLTAQRSIANEAAQTDPRMLFMVEWQGDGPRVVPAEAAVLGARLHVMTPPVSSTHNQSFTSTDESVSEGSSSVSLGSSLGESLMEGRRRTSRRMQWQSKKSGIVLYGQVRNGCAGRDAGLAGGALNISDIRLIPLTSITAAAPRNTCIKSTSITPRGHEAHH